jgi:hypothetical protein
MDLAALFELLVKNYGPQAGLFAVMLWMIIVLAKKYDAVMQSRIKEGVDFALAMERNTQTIEALRELIKDRKP